MGIKFFSKQSPIEKIGGDQSFMNALQELGNGIVKYQEQINQEALKAGIAAGKVVVADFVRRPPTPDGPIAS